VYREATGAVAVAMAASEEDGLGTDIGLDIKVKL